MRDYHEPMSDQHLSSSNTECRREAAGPGMRAAALGCAGILAVTMLAGGCGEDPPPMDPVDDDPGFAVRGTATGVLGAVALELRWGSDAEPLTVTEEGAFAFVTRLADGTSYTVVLVDPDVPCTLRNQTGVIAGVDTAIELTCTGASLDSVVVSGIAPTIMLLPGATEYVVDLPLSQPSVTLTVTVATPGDTLAIAGTPVDSGAPSAEITLSLGDNPVDIVVENDLGWQRTYRLVLRRAATLAQYAYGKESSIGPGYFGPSELGYSLAVSGDTLAVGAIAEDSAATGVNGNQDDHSASYSGAVYVFRRTGAVWQQEAYIKASNTDADDQFGYSLALLGDTLAVGAIAEASATQGVDGNQGDNSAFGTGAVYVFRRTGAAWQQEAYLKASNANAGDGFGASVALSEDILAVGATGEASAATGVNGNQDNNFTPESGAVYVFRRTGTSWQQEAYLKASNTDAGDLFGHSIAFSGDTLAVGALGEASASQGLGGNQNDNFAWYSGAVYVFRRFDTAWEQEAYLKASNTDGSDYFGHSVALSGDTLVVGAYGEDSAAQGVGGNQDDDSALQSGAIYVFHRTGTSWQQEAYLKDFTTGARGSSLIA